jgi:hypothetical protein
VVPPALAVIFQHSVTGWRRDFAMPAAQLAVDRTFRQGTEAMRTLILFAPLLLTVPAEAQPIMPDEQPRIVIAALPAPSVPENSPPSAYLQAAQAALAAGRIGQAQEALEMAQTRLLDRSVPLGQTNDPSDNPAVGQISQALQALQARDRAGCMHWIETAIGTLTKQGL